jgi:STE24 endopeptidase
MFTLIFLAALVVMVLTKLWLASRQIRHVGRHRGAVPERFADTITLSAHQKAADYTIARTRLSMLEVLAGAAVLIGFTLLGGLHALNQLWLRIRRRWLLLWRRADRQRGADRRAD